MELDQCILGRRSIRVYKKKKMKKGDIEKLLRSGVWAPSGMNGQPWRFIVVEDVEKIKELSDEVKKIVLTQDWASNFKDVMSSGEDVIFYNAPLLILVCIERGNLMFRDVNLLDCGLLAQNMLLKAYDLGLGSCFIGFANLLNLDANALKNAGVPDGMELVAPLIFGYPDEEPDPKTRSQKIIQWIKS